jgi:hypothetical protein
VDVSWSRRGDAFVQVAALAVTGWCATSSPRDGAAQLVVAAVAVLLVWVTGVLPGARSARTVALVALLAVNGAVTMVWAHHPPQLAALAVSMLAAAAGHFAPHPDTITVEPVAPDPRTSDGLADALIADLFPPGPQPAVRGSQEDTAHLGPLGIVLRRISRT